MVPSYRDGGGGEGCRIRATDIVNGDSIGDKFLEINLLAVKAETLAPYEATGKQVVDHPCTEDGSPEKRGLLESGYSITVGKRIIKIPDLVRGLVEVHTEREARRD